MPKIANTTPAPAAQDGAAALSATSAYPQRGRGAYGLARCRYGCGG